MDTRSYSKTQNQKKCGRSALYLIPFGVSEIRQSTGKTDVAPKNIKITKKQNEGALRRVFYIFWGVGTQQLSYALKSQESG